MLRTAKMQTSEGEDDRGTAGACGAEELHRAPAQDRAAVPAHVGIIMDGNGRWAAARGMPRLEGHRRGVEALRAAVKSASDLGVRYLTVYSFSSENWTRPIEEVSDLMGVAEALHPQGPGRPPSQRRQGADHRGTGAPDARHPRAARRGRGVDRGQRWARPRRRVQLRQPTGNRRCDAQDRRGRRLGRHRSGLDRTRHRVGPSRHGRHPGPRSHHPHLGRAAGCRTS